jgi:N-acetylmuramoyl-L-alanine amidase
MQFDQLPKYNTVDNLQQSKLFYVDLYGMTQSYNNKTLTVDDNTLKYIDSRSYAPHGVLRLVFYTKEGTGSFKVQTVNDPPRIVIDTVRDASVATAPPQSSPPSAAQATGSANLTVDVMPAQATPATTVANAAPTAEVPKIPEPSLRPKGGKWKIVIIDPGHGGANSGASSKAQINGQTVHEKDLTLQFAYYLKKIIDSSPNMVALVTRADDSNLGLGERVRFAENNEGDLFISVHMNDGNGNNSARGMELYFMSDKATVDGAIKAVEERENKEVGNAGKGGSSLLKSLITEYEKEGLREWQYESSVFCRHMEASMLTMPFFSSNYRGIKSANFAVLKNFRMPAILAEIGFITNSEDLKFLVNPQFQEATATVIFNAINSYFARTDPEFKPQQRSVR